MKKHLVLSHRVQCVCERLVLVSLHQLTVNSIFSSTECLIIFLLCGTPGMSLEHRPVLIAFNADSICNLNTDGVTTTANIFV